MAASAHPPPPPGYRLGAGVRVTLGGGGGGGGGLPSTVEGAVAAYDAACDVLALRLPGGGLRLIPGRLIGGVVAAPAAAGSPPAAAAAAAVASAGGVPAATREKLAAAARRVGEVVGRERARVGVGVGADGQAVFDALAKTYVLLVRSLHGVARDRGSVAVGGRGGKRRLACAARSCCGDLGRWERDCVRLHAWTRAVVVVHACGRQLWWWLLSVTRCGNSFALLRATCPSHTGGASWGYVRRSWTMHGEANLPRALVWF